MLSFVGAGLVAWRGRPERLTGALMVGTGFALFAGTLVDANRSVPFTVGLALSPLATAVLAHLVLAFPDGRLHSGLERFLVVAAYVNATRFRSRCSCSWASSTSAVALARAISCSFVTT